MTDHSFYQVKDRADRILFKGSFRECLSFMAQVSDCLGPYPQGNY